MMCDETKSGHSNEYGINDYIEYCYHSGNGDKYGVGQAAGYGTGFCYDTGFDLGLSGTLKEEAFVSVHNLYVDGYGHDDGTGNG